MRTPSSPLVRGYLEGIRESAEHLADMQRQLAEERTACVVKRREDGYWLILNNSKGAAAINLSYEEREPIVQGVIEAAAIRARP